MSFDLSCTLEAINFTISFMRALPVCTSAAIANLSAGLQAIEIATMLLGLAENVDVDALYDEYCVTDEVIVFHWVPWLKNLQSKNGRKFFALPSKPAFFPRITSAAFSITGSSALPERVFSLHECNVAR
jgi:hypothetical protein